MFCSLFGTYCYKHGSCDHDKIDDDDDEAEITEFTGMFQTSTISIMRLF